MTLEEEEDLDEQQQSVEATSERDGHARRSNLTWPKAIAIVAAWGAVVGVAIFADGLYAACTAMFAWLATSHIA